MATPYKTSTKDFYIVMGVVAFIAIGTILGIVNIFVNNKSQGAGPQPTSI